MTKGLARVISIDEAKISNDIDQPVLITPGVYEAVMVDWKKMMHMRMVMKECNQNRSQITMYGVRG